MLQFYPPSCRFDKEWISIRIKYHKLRFTYLSIYRNLKTYLLFETVRSNYHTSQKNKLYLQRGRDSSHRNTTVKRWKPLKKLKKGIAEENCLHHLTREEMESTASSCSFYFVTFRSFLCLFSFFLLVIVSLYFVISYHIIVNFKSWFFYVIIYKLDSNSSHNIL